MKLAYKNTLLAAIVVVGASTFTVQAAQAECGIECWLRNTFSTNDFVGDWLRDTFGGVREGGAGNGKLHEALQSSNKIAAQWHPGAEII